MEKISVFGHKNPDTDSICSAIAYSELKQKLHDRNLAKQDEELKNMEKLKMTKKQIKDKRVLEPCKYTPYRLGQINKETDFVLKYFSRDVPEILDNVKAMVEDLSMYKPIKLKINDPVKMAWDYINFTTGSRIVPVVDEDKILKGLISTGDITQIFMNPVVNSESKLMYDIEFENLLIILGGKKIYGDYNYKKVEGHLYIGSSILESDDIDITDKDIIITSKLKTAVKFALEYNCGCVILVNDIKPEGLSESSAAVVVVDKNLYNTIAVINQAISIGSVMVKKRMEVFSTNNYIEDIVDTMKTSSHRNFPVVDDTGKYVGIISRRHLLSQKKKKVILVDHNERSQSVEGLDQASIAEIIDHHRVADIQTESPLYIRSEPVGCTGTIIYKMYNENNIEIEKSTAGLLLSAILSDTLVFSSPTCTKYDEEAAHSLAEICELNIGDYSREMFIAGTSLEGYTPDDILSIDMKKFSFGKYSAAVSQVSTLDFRSISNIKNDLVKAMEDYRERENVDMVILMVTDILAVGSEILVVATKQTKAMIAESFGMKESDNSIFLDDVVSRKKQMVPKLASAVQTI